MVKYILQAIFLRDLTIMAVFIVETPTGVLEYIILEMNIGRKQEDIGTKAGEVLDYSILRMVQFLLVLIT